MVTGTALDVALGFYVALLVIGLGAALAFLARYRPLRLLRWATLNSAGWVIVIALLYARTLILLWFKLPLHPPPSWNEALFSLGMLAAIDTLLVLRVISFSRYLKRHQKSESKSRKHGSN